VDRLTWLALALAWRWSAASSMTLWLHRAIAATA